MQLNTVRELGGIGLGHRGIRPRVEYVSHELKGEELQVCSRRCTTVEMFWYPRRLFPGGAGTDICQRTLKILGPARDCRHKYVISFRTFF